MLNRNWLTRQIQCQMDCLPFFWNLFGPPSSQQILSIRGLCWPPWLPFCWSRRQSKCSLVCFQTDAPQSFVHTVNEAVDHFLSILSFVCYFIIGRRMVRLLVVRKCWRPLWQDLVSGCWYDCYIPKQDDKKKANLWVGQSSAPIDDHFLLDVCRRLWWKWKS